jgi:hypothetical protein
MAKRKNYIVSKNPDGTVTVAPMRTWLQQNPDRNPTGMDHLSRAYRLKGAFRKNGWEIKEFPDRFLMIVPDENGDTSFADDLIDDEVIDEEQDDDFADAAEITFGLERDLQSALRANISQLESGLTIVDAGRERTTEAGRIDIAAQDSKGNLVIIELKAGLATPEVIAQVLAYMGAVAESDGVPVRGILVAGDFHKRVVWAARAIPNLELKKYSFQFSFESLK